MFARSFSFPSASLSVRSRRLGLGLGVLVVLFLASFGPVILAQESAAVTESGGPTQLTEKIRGGSVVPIGSLEAVVGVGPNNGRNCTGTLIADDTVLSAAHCFCGGSTCPSDISQCAARASVFFDDVFPVGSSTRQDQTLTGDVIVHPNYCNNGGWLVQDYVVIKLDQPASSVVQVAPIFVETPENDIKVGDSATLVGYGSTNTAGSTTNCNMGGGGFKRQGITALDDYVVYEDPSWGGTLFFDDTSVGACPGDSGGPALNAAGRVVGVSSVSNMSTNSSYDPTAMAWDWLSENACPEFDPANPDWSFCNNPLCPCPSSAGDCDNDNHCVAGAECILDVGVASGLPAGFDTCWQGNELVTLFAGTGYSGANRTLPIGDWGVGSLSSVGNDTISSLVASPGLTVRLCSENGGWGNCQEFAGVVTLSGNSLDNNTSNVEILPGVTVFDYSGFSGTQQTFPVGEYGASDLTIIGNDDVSALIVFPGINARLCSENGGWGNCQEFSGEVSYIGSLLDQRTSNIEVRPGVTVYRGRTFEGVSQSFAEGVYDHTALTVVGNDQIRSLVVAPGMKVTLCSESGGWGDCEEFTGWVSFVGNTLDRRTSYIEVSPL